MPSSKEYYNAWGASRALLALEKKTKGQPLLIIVPDVKSLENAVSELSFFSDGLPVLEFPPYTQQPFEEARVLSNVMARRSETLYAMLREKDFVAVATPYSVLKKVAPAEDFSSRAFDLSQGLVLPREELARRLDALGYVQVEFVNGPGEYNIRGGLADAFPVGSDDPVRIEYFDDEVEHLFYYNPDTQTKIRSCESVLFLPASDVLLSTEEFASSLSDSEAAEKAETYGKFAGFHWYAPEAGYEQGDLFSYMGESWSAVCVSPCWREDFDVFYKGVVSAARASGIPLAEACFLSPDDAASRIFDAGVSVIAETAAEGSATDAGFKSTSVRFSFEKNNLYQSMTNAMSALTALLRDGFSVIVCVESDKFASIFKEFARDFEIFPPEITNLKDTTGPGAYLYRRRVSGGFVDDSRKLAVIADSDIFGFSKRKTKTRKKDVFNTNLADLEEGDYVVHVNHGIGVYEGLKHLTIAGVEGDFLTLRYDGDDILYVPLPSISQLQKYVGLQDQKPRLNSLKSSAWAKLKKHAKESARNVAQDLLRLYAERKAKKGYAFLDDGILLGSFERDFPYDETEDQLSAIIDVYKDMECDVPMERLVCGDVGFGKTEVAMRAACKAVACGKQVAVLVPTTILARQHCETFTKRFEKLPVAVDFVSRFRTAAETRDIFERASSGKLDILIGTHKILSKDLTFKDLGLLIVDEEQRFGVSHKEKIAAMKRSVDTLTLSATPIPRTLQLSLSGIRDMSVIETPPENRLPVVVKVVKGTQGIGGAVKTELERGGQVFVLHNRVADIEEVASKVRDMVPHARIDYAHGQMDAKSLEKILQSFYSGEIDVLISTTIIENGIDIPNVNTIIINNAANFGLSQLYQLKGRVGRSDRRGYCYLAVNNFSALSPIAKKRLSIIQQLSDLGSGFKIAMYDLQLRGAGNILGAEQSGFVVRVGYELYVSMIEEAVTEMKGEYANVTDTEINSNIPYFIPADYVENPRVRFDFYRRFASFYDSETMNDLFKELEAGYGELRPEVRNLGYVMLIKNLAGRFGAVKVGIARTSAKVEFSKDTGLDPLLIGKAAASCGTVYKFTSEFELSLAIKEGDTPSGLVAFFEKLAMMSSPR